MGSNFHSGQMDTLITGRIRKAGQPRATLLLYLTDHNRWIVVASNGGADWARIV